MKKANPVQITSDNIGKYSNDCAKIWGKGNITQEALDSLKMLVAESNWSIR